MCIFPPICSSLLSTEAETGNDLEVFDQVWAVHFNLDYSALCRPVPGPSPTQGPVVHVHV